MLVPIRSAESPTACMRFNYHRDHFGLTWGLEAQTSRPPIPHASRSASTGWPSHFSRRMDRRYQVAGDGGGQPGVVRPTHHRRLGLSRSVPSNALR
jgi:hypothetical protein